MADKRKILYDALTAKNIPLGSYDLYLAKIATPENRKKLFDVATKSGIPVGDYNRFETELVGNQKMGRIEDGLLSKAEQDVERKKQLTLGAINAPFGTINRAIQQNYPRVADFSGRSGMNLVSDVADILVSPVTTATSGAYKFLNTAPTTQEKINAGLETVGGGVAAPFMANPAIRGAAVGFGTLLKSPLMDSTALKTGIEFAGSPAQTLTGKQGGTPETIDRLYQLGTMAVGMKKGFTSPKAREAHLEKQRVATYESGLKSVLPQLKQNTKSINTPEMQEAITHNNAVKAGKINAPLKPIPLSEGTTEFNQIIKESVPLVQDVLQETGKVKPTKFKSAHKQFAEILDIANKRVLEKYEFVADKYKDVGIMFKGEPTTVGELNSTIKWINAQKSVKGLGKLKTEYELQSELASRPRLATMINDVNEARSALFDTYEKLGVKGIPEARKLLSNNIKLQELVNNRVAAVENEINLTGSALHRVYPSKWGLAEAAISTPYRKTIGKFFSDDQKLARSINALYKAKPQEYAKVTERGVKGLLTAGARRVPESGFGSQMRNEPPFTQYGTPPVQKQLTAGSGGRFNQPEWNPSVGSLQSPNYELQAQQLGVKYKGMQNFKNYPSMPNFHDPVTGSDFTMQAGETLAQALQRKRKQFGQ